MKKNIFLLLSLCLLVVLTNCKKETPSPQSTTSVSAPPPNTVVKAKYVTKSKSFDLVKDLYKVNANIAFNNQYPDGTAHLWLFGDRAISREENPVVSFDAVGIFPVTHIVTINDSTQNVYSDTLFIGDMISTRYRVTAATYSYIYMKLWTNGIALQSYKVHGNVSQVPYGMYVYNGHIRSEVVDFQMLSESDDAILLSNTLDITRVAKVATSDSAGKFLCINQNGNEVWMNFLLTSNGYTYRMGQE